MKWFVIFCVSVVVVLTLISTSKPFRLRRCLVEYRMTSSQFMRGRFVERAKKLMTTESLRYVLENYQGENDIHFAVGMISVSRSGEDTDLLWEMVHSNPPGSQVRVICMAQLINRGFFDVWQYITDEDIEMLSTSMPVHIVHWKNLLIRYSGRPSRYLRNDPFPERYKFKALFRECIEKYHAEETKRMMKEM